MNILKNFRPGIHAEVLKSLLELSYSRILVDTNELLCSQPTGHFSPFVLRPTARKYGVRFHKISMTENLVKLRYFMQYLLSTDRKFNCTKKFFIKDSFSKREKIHRRLWICSHLLNNFLMENLIFYARFSRSLRFFQ